MDERRSSGYRGSYVWPIFLVGLGVVFLLKNLGVLEFDTWEMIWRLWPLILVGMGLDSLLHNQGIAAPTIFIGLGLIILLDNYGYISVNIWSLLLRYWPLMIVAIGIDVLVGRRKLWISMLISLILLVFILGLVFSGAGRTGQRVEIETIQEPAGVITQADIDLRYAVGEISISGTSDSTNLIDAQLPESNFIEPNYNFSEENNSANITLWSWFGGFVFPSQDQQLKSDVILLDSVNYDIEMSLGVGVLISDLADLTITDAAINEGVGKLEIVLPETGDYVLGINQAIGTMNIIVPEGLNVRFDVSRVVSGLNYPEGYTLEDSTLLSPNFNPENDSIELQINQVFGNIIIESIP